MRLVNGQAMDEPPASIAVQNVSWTKQNLGWIRFNPNETKDVPADQANELLRMPQFVDAQIIAERSVKRSIRTRPISVRSSGLVTEVRKSLQPDPPIQEWVSEFNREVFPCQTDEFDPITNSEKTFGIVFRLVDCSEMNGGTRFILRLAGYLGARGHRVRLSFVRSLVTQEDLEGIPVRLTQDHAVPDEDFVCGTYWTTIREVAASPLGGRRLGLLQAPEPSWPESRQYRKQAEASFTDPSVAYFSIGPSLTDVCRQEYGTKVYCMLPGSCIDSVAFGPRINDYAVRDRVFLIYRRAPWKGLETVLEVVKAYKKLRPQTRVVAMGFNRWAHPLIDEYRMDPPTDDIPDLYSGSDFYITAGKFEGSPLPPLEAMACGCIPVSTESGVLDYLRDGENGLLLDPQKTGTTAQRMADVMDDEKLRQGLKRNGLLTARARPMALLFSAFEEGVLGLCD